MRLFSPLVCCTTFLGWGRWLLSSLCLLAGCELGQYHNIAGLFAAIVDGDNLLLHTPIMLKRAVAIGRNGGVVDIDILPLVGGDKAVATLVVEPFYTPCHR